MPCVGIGCFSWYLNLRSKFFDSFEGGGDIGLKTIPMPRWLVILFSLLIMTNYVISTQRELCNSCKLLFTLFVPNLCTSRKQNESTLDMWQEKKPIPAADREQGNSYQHFSSINDSLFNCY